MVEFQSGYGKCKIHMLPRIYYRLVFFSSSAYGRVGKKKLVLLHYVFEIRDIVREEKLK